MSLQNKLARLQSHHEKLETIDRENYKAQWIADLNMLNQQIAHNWLKEYETQELLKTTFLFEIKLDFFIGEYVSAVLDIELPNKYFIALEPVSSISENHNGHLMLYLRGDRSKKVDIYRILNSDKVRDVRWETAGVSKDLIDIKRVVFNKKELEQIIEKWIQY